MNRIYPAEFIIYVYFKTFKSYIWALSLFSMTLTIVVSAAAKYLYQECISADNYNSIVKGAFQLSVFLFIPLFFALLNLKYKRKFIEEGTYSELNMPMLIAWFFSVLMLSVSAILLTFLLVIW